MAVRLSRRGLDRADVTQHGERRLRPDPLRILTGGDQQLSGSNRTVGLGLDERRRDLFDTWRRLLVGIGYFLVKEADMLGQTPKRTSGVYWRPLAASPPCP